MKHDQEELLSIINQLFDNLQTRESINNSRKQKRMFVLDDIKPGYIISFIKNKTNYFGIVLNRSVVVYIDNSGKIIGYLTNFFDNPFIEIQKIVRTSSTYYKFNDIEHMDIIWEKSAPKVQMSISEVEKGLGLTEGSLEITSK